MPDIQVTNLSKVYKTYPNQWARLAEWILPSHPARHRKHWVLHDLSFHLSEGEAIGVVGQNGAGKSTLLKILTGTVQPSEGSVERSGRVAALLELGMGFHPEFTGRQNVFMAGQLLGLEVEEIRELMPQIEDFAEIGEYIDQQVRMYSSGMLMRLAFSVATAHRPDLLIVDEALSVGDTYFQHKSFDRIKEFSAQGTTLMIASHDRYAIQSVCDRAMLLDKGRMCMEGEPLEVMDYYNALMADREGESIERTKLADGTVSTVSGTREATVEALYLLNSAGKATDTVEVGDDLQLVVEVRIEKDIPRLVLGFMITDRLGQAIYGINTHRLDQPVYDLKAGEKVVYRFRFQALLGKGNYAISLSLSKEDSHLVENFEWSDRAMVFHVFNTKQEDFVGTSWLQAEAIIDRGGEAERNTA